jgi:F0F1-type ATP synthase membrane subunit b/b'
MNISTADYIFLFITVGLMVIMFFLYRRTRNAMKANIREILEEYKELKQMASELRKGAENREEEETEASHNPETPQKEIDDYKDYQLRDYIYEVRQKNKADIERAIKKLKEEIQIDLEKKLDQVQVKAKKVKPELKEKKIKKEKPKEEKPKEIDLDLSEEHLNILYNLAEETEEIALGVLFENYKKVFPDKERKEFQVIVRELLENNMIRESYAAAGDFFFTVTNEGLVYIRKKM